MADKKMITVTIECMSCENPVEVMDYGFNDNEQLELTVHCSQCNTTTVETFQFTGRDIADIRPGSKA